MPAPDERKDGWVEPIELDRDAALCIPDGEKAMLHIKPGPSRPKMLVELDLGVGCDVGIMSIVGRATILTLRCRVGANSTVSGCGLWLEGGEGKLSYDLEGDGARAYDIQLFVASKDKTLRLDTRLRHIGHGTKGEMITKGVVRDNASADISGMTNIMKSGEGAESFLSEHAMLLSPDAHASASPVLEIDNNDVSSRHSASVSRIDERKIFYLMSRGLPRESASAVIVEGFFNSAIEKIGSPDSKEEVSRKALEAL